MSTRRMPLRVAACCLAACLMWPADGRAQDVGESAAPESVAVAAPVSSGEAAPQSSAEGFWAPFRVVPDDFGRFFTLDTVTVVGVGGAGALAAHPFDVEGPDPSRAPLHPGRYKAGNIGGGVPLHLAVGFGLYSVARAGGSTRVASIGADIMRAQILGQGIVQAGKMSTQRPRPDGSNNHSLPSGHTASAFATATVLHRHLGWKAGVPAFAFGAYVAGSRMASHKHYLSDVLLGASLGIAAGRTVTVGRNNGKLAVGVAPVHGGAAIAFTRTKN